MAGTFAADITKFCKRYKGDIQTAVRKITFEAFKRIILRTPVDTGRARANWAVTVGTATTFQIEDADKSGTATLKAAQDGTLAWNCTGSIFMSNNLPYIGVLEYGKEDGTPGSKQAPRGMVRVSVEEMHNWIQAQASKETLTSIRETIKAGQ